MSTRRLALIAADGPSRGPPPNRSVRPRIAPANQFHQAIEHSTQLFLRCAAEPLADAFRREGSNLTDFDPRACGGGRPWSIRGALHRPIAVLRPDPIWRTPRPTASGLVEPAFQPEPIPRPGSDS